MSGRRASVWAGAAIALAGCVTVETEQQPTPAAVPAVVRTIEPPPVDGEARGEEARALIAQAETDIQRARARRALWSRAWEALVGARASLAAGDHAATILNARRASELAQLGLEQLAYPAVGLHAAVATEPAAPGSTTPERAEHRKGSPR